MASLSFVLIDISFLICCVILPAFDCGAYYSDVRSALTDAITNVVQNNADVEAEMKTAQDTVEFNIAG